MRRGFVSAEITIRSRSVLGTPGLTADPIATTARMFSLADTVSRNLQTHSRDLSVGQRRIRAGAYPEGLRELRLIVNFLFHKLGDGIDVPFDLGCDQFRVQVGRRDVAIGCIFAGLVQVAKQLLDVG